MNGYVDYGLYITLELQLFLDDGDSMKYIFKTIFRVLAVSIHRLLQFTPHRSCLDESKETSDNTKSAIKRKHSDEIQSCYNEKSALVAHCCLSTNHRIVAFRI